jgi:hypothetical protein
VDIGRAMYESGILAASVELIPHRCREPSSLSQSRPCTGGAFVAFRHPLSVFRLHMRIDVGFYPLHRFFPHPFSSVISDTAKFSCTFAPCHRHHSRPRCPPSSTPRPSTLSRPLRLRLLPGRLPFKQVGLRSM